MRGLVFVLCSSLFAGCSETPKPLQIDSPREGEAKHVVVIPEQGEPSAVVQEATAESPNHAVLRAIALLEAGSYRLFLDQFLRPEQQANADAILSRFNTNAAAVEHLIAALKSVESTEPTFEMPTRAVFDVPESARQQPNDPTNIVLNRNGNKWGGIEFPTRPDN